MFIRAERKDELEVTEVAMRLDDTEIPDTLTVVQRLETYYGPKFRVEADDDEQYLLTIPGPDTQALFWRKEEYSWVKTAELRLEFTGELPQYEMCPACGDPLSTLTHERRAAIGACTR